jgi:hypothetical protein
MLVASSERINVHHVGHCPLCDVHLIYTTFWELALVCLHLTGCHYTDTCTFLFLILVATVWIRSSAC